MKKRKKEKKRKDGNRDGTWRILIADTPFYLVSCKSTSNKMDWNETG